MKNKKTIIYLSTLIGLIAAILGIFYLLNSSLSSMPDTDKKQTKENLYEYVIKNIDKDSKIVDFEVTPNNNFEGVYGLHTLYVKTKNGVEYEVGIDNDKVNKDGSFDEKDLYDNFIRAYTYDYIDKKIKEIYNDERISALDLESSYNETRLYYSDIDLYHSEYEEYVLVNSNELTLKEYLDKNADELLKNYMYLDMTLTNNDNALIEDLDEKTVEEFYDLYKTVMDKYDNQFILLVDIYQYDNKTEESSRISLNDESNKTIVSKEDYLNYIKNYQQHKVVDENEEEIEE